MIHSKVTPINEAREFHLSELFFSLTNDKGCIEFGNAVFTRISGYDESELIHQPHSLIRHPDMPRGVFHLFWEYLQQGKTIAAYVKNLAKDGRYYWVMAVACPCRTGFLSVRIKPSGPLFKKAKELYAETLIYEAEIEFKHGKKEAAEQSHAYLLKRLVELGFESYDAFMSTALNEELKLRDNFISDTHTGHRNLQDRSHETALLFELQNHSQYVSDMLGRVFSSLDIFHQLANELPSRRENMAELGPTLSFLALNTHISASRLGDAGATLSVISQAIRTLSKDTDRLIDDLLAQIEELCSTAESLEFDVAVASLESRISADFANELLSDRLSHSEKRTNEWFDIVTKEMSQRTSIVFDKLKDLLQLAITLSSDAKTLSRHVHHMHVAQLNGSIEIAAFNNNASFQSIFEEISSVVTFALNECDQILELLSGTKISIEELIKLESDLEQGLDSIDKVNQLTLEDDLRSRAIQIVSA